MADASLPVPSTSPLIPYVTGNPPMEPIVTPMTPADWETVRRILQDGIATGHASFDTEVPEWDAWDRSHLEACRLVARVDGRDSGLGRPESGLHPVRPIGCRGSQRVRRIPLQGNRGRQGPDGGTHRRFGARGNLDAPGWGISGECRQHRTSEGVRVPGSGPAGCGWVN